MVSSMGVSKTEDVVSALGAASSVRISNLSQLNDQLGLVGLVLGRLVLLEIASSAKFSARDRVAAARALASLKEDPGVIAERLRASPLADLSVDQLESLVGELRSADLGAVSLDVLLEKVKSKGKE